MTLKNCIAGAITAAVLPGAAPAMTQEELTVWWVKGCCKSEDDALFAAAKKFQAKHPKIGLARSQCPIQNMIPKSVSALDSGSPPDVAYADVLDCQVTAKWAHDGKLEDITSVIDPIRTRFAPNTARAGKRRNPLS